MSYKKLEIRQLVKELSVEIPMKQLTTSKYFLKEVH